MSEETDVGKPEFKLPTVSSKSIGTSVSSNEKVLPDSSSNKDSKEGNVKKSDRANCSIPSSGADNPGKVPVALKYNEPEWSGDPPDDFSFEIIKQGTIISTVRCRKPFLVVGRLPKCDIPMEHPTISRHHAVIQYCKGASDKKAGFYLYDLGSTHGTLLNKEQIHKNVYYLLKVGYVIKFGLSTRLFVFQGPEEEEAEQPSETPGQSCNWGMGEDAKEEEDLTENPFALTTANEDLYVSDPKKTLRGWFEREGYELEYKVEEKGSGNFMCSIQLPIDNPTGDYITVDATVKGKKKEAVIACALEACRMLDRFNLLRQSQHESHQRKKKKWEEDDFYDSDEDPFLDQTGTLEKKREWRKKLDKKNVAENHNSIVKKLNSITQEIDAIKERLRQSNAAKVRQDDDGDADSLDSYMMQISDPTVSPLDPITKSKLNMTLTELQKQKVTYEKLRDASVSAKLPVLLTPKPIPSSTERPIHKTKVVQKSETKMVQHHDVKAEKPLNVQTVADRTSKASTTKIEKDNNSNRPTKEKAKEKMEDKNNSIPKNTDEKHVRPVFAKSVPKKKAKTDYDSHEDYCTWVPPLNQTGDGTTHLNTKFGY